MKIDAKIVKVEWIGKKSKDQELILELRVKRQPIGEDHDNEDFFKYHTGRCVLIQDGGFARDY
jgi:hypothetical protein